MKLGNTFHDLLIKDVQCDPATSDGCNTPNASVHEIDPINTFQIKEPKVCRR